MFLSIYKRFFSLQFEEHETKEDAIFFLERGSDEGEIFKVAVYDLSTQSIVWSNVDYISKEKIDKEVYIVLIEYLFESSIKMLKALERRSNGDQITKEILKAENMMYLALKNMKKL